MRGSATFFVVFGCIVLAVTLCSALGVLALTLYKTDAVLPRWFVNGVVACLGTCGLGGWLLVIAARMLENLRRDRLLREALLNQETFDARLTKVALELRRLGLHQNHTQRVLASSPQEEPEAQKELARITAEYNALEKVFFAVCWAGETLGYSARKTSDDRFSVKLYWPQEKAA